MSTYKRRIVYFSDPEWEQLAQLAKGREMTISATVRDMLEETIGSETEARRIIKAQPARQAQAKRDDLARFPAGGVQARQARRDALLGKINRSK